MTSCKEDMGREIKLLLMLKGKRKKKRKIEGSKSRRQGEHMNTDRHCSKKLYCQGESLFSINIKREEKYQERKI
jgi:hypothetical protein